MSSSSVRVAVRVRPLTEQESHCDNLIRFTPNSPQITVGNDRAFTFDYVYSPESDQQHIFDTCVVPLLSKYLEGYNATILAYGQTGSGKTYSMGIGLDSALEQNDAQQGIVPRFIHALFNQLEEKKKATPRYTFQVYASFLELYNEDLVDLLCPAKREGLHVSIREDIHGNICWVGVTEEVVRSPQALLELLQKGSIARTTASTDMNRSSSRSHAIFSVLLKQGDSDSTQMFSKFHFVDLAGSERLKRTNAVGDRAKEGISINTGLLALGNVISALGDESRRVSHIPYRDSKLTRLLQDSLGGNSQTLMLSCVSPASINITETLNTLKYANRARNIRNRATVNLTMDETDRLKAQIARLKEELRGGDDFLRAVNHEMDSLKVEVESLNRTIRQMAAELSTAKQERDMLLKCSQLQDANGENLLAEYRRTIEALRMELSRERVPNGIPTPATTPVNEEDLETLVGSTSREESAPTGDAERQESEQDKSAKKKQRHSFRVGSKRSIRRRRPSISAAVHSPKLPNRRPQSKATPTPTRMLHQMKALLREDVTYLQQLRCADTRQALAEAFADNTYAPSHNQANHSRNDEYATLLDKLQRSVDQRCQLIDFAEHQHEAAVGLQRAMADQMAHQTTLVKQHRREMSELKSQLEGKLKKLTAEHQTLKRKHTQLTQATESTRAKHNAVIVNLKAKLDKATMEKKRQTKRMKQDQDRYRERQIAYERDIQRLKKQEAAAVAARKRLEREVAVHKSLVKRAGEDMSTLNGQMKQVTLLLKKMLAMKDDTLNRSLLTKAVACASVRGVMMKQSFSRRGKTFKLAPIQQRVLQKKRLVQQAITLHATHHATDKPIQELTQQRERLIQEQQELLSERRLVLEEEAIAQGCTTIDSCSPQYMDDRIDTITTQLDFIHQHIQYLRQPMLTNPDKEWTDIIDTGLQTPDINADVAYEVALAIVRSLEPEEARLICEGLMEEVIRLTSEQHANKLSIRHLHYTLQRLQNGLVQMRRAAPPNEHSVRADMVFCRTMQEAVVIRDGLALFPYACI